MLPATATDIDLLLELMAEYYAYDGLHFDPALARGALKQLLADERLGRAWLIRDGEDGQGRVAGYLFFTFGFSLEFGGRFGLVDELYVRPEYRGRGLGAAALAFAEKTAAAMGFCAVRLEVEHENRRAQKLYQSIGFNAHPRDLMTKWILSPPSGAAGESRDDRTEKTPDR